MFKTFLRKERGSVTVESVLWLPVFVGLLLFAVDVTSLMNTHTRLYTITSDASRMVSLGVMTEQEAKDWVAAFGGDSQTISVEIFQDANTVVTIASVPFSDAARFGPLALATSTNLAAQSAYRKEPAT